MAMFGIHSVKHSGAVIRQSQHRLFSFMLVAMVDLLPCCCFCLPKVCFRFSKLSALPPSACSLCHYYIPTVNSVVVVGIESEPEDKNMCDSLNTELIKHKLCVM